MLLALSAPLGGAAISVVNLPKTLWTARVSETPVSMHVWGGVSVSMFGMTNHLVTHIGRNRTRETGFFWGFFFVSNPHMHRIHLKCYMYGHPHHLFYKFSNFTPPSPFWAFFFLTFSDFTPQVGEFEGLPGLITSLSETGHLAVYYLGTEPKQSLSTGSAVTKVGAYLWRDNISK